MALGTTMDSSTIIQTLISDCQYVRGFIEWAERRKAAYSNLNETILTNAGLSSGDITQVEGFQTFITYFLQFAGGTTPSALDSVENMITLLLGMS